MPIDFTLHQAKQLADLWGGDEALSKLTDAEIAALGIKR